MSEIQNYDEAVKLIKTAILQSQYDAARSINEKQLMLYYGIGKYISMNSRKGFWGKGAIDTISERLDKELPGLKGFSARNLRYMRTFYEEWSFIESSELPMNNLEEGNLAPAGAKLEIVKWNLSVPNQSTFPFESFFAISFSHHRTILSEVKSLSCTGVPNKQAQLNRVFKNAHPGVHCQANHVIVSNSSN